MKYILCFLFAAISVITNAQYENDFVTYESHRMYESDSNESLSNLVDDLYPVMPAVINVNTNTNTAWTATATYVEDGKYKTALLKGVGDSVKSFKPSRSRTWYPCTTFIHLCTDTPWIDRFTHEVSINGRRYYFNKLSD